MLIATFNETTGWAGKTVVFENEQFILEDHGPISAADVMEYDRQGHLTWAYDGLQAWVEQLAVGRSAPPEEPQPVAPQTEVHPRRQEPCGGAMQIAAFGPGTGWSGKTIKFENEQFILEGHGPISAADVMTYDSRGHLVWATEGTRGWVGAKSRIPATQGASQPAGMEAGAGRPTNQVAGATRPIKTYRVFYLGGHPAYPKRKIAEIKLRLFEDRFEFEPTTRTKKWFSGLTIPYGSILGFEIVQRQVNSVEGILGGLNSRQLNQANNIHIKYDSGAGVVLIRFEMLSGVTVMGQAKECRELEDRIQIHKIREKFRQAEAVSNGGSQQVEDIPAQIEKLAALRDKDIISSDEFEAKKADLLSRM
jgi:hypothetical protein